ncbi:MAG: patatin-like phospholipase family protein [Bryobacterales bacterium]|nr:patatin-like phospholipase family protein [Bryobacterales bacterium]
MHSFWAYVYLLRVPLLTWLSVLLFGPVAAEVDLLRNLLLGDERSLAWAFLAAFLACRCAQAAANNIVQYGHERFGMSFRRPGPLLFGAAGAVAGAMGGVGSLIAGFCATAFAISTGSRALALSSGFVALLLFIPLESWWGAMAGFALFAVFAWAIDRYETAFTSLDHEMWTHRERTQVEAAMEFFLFASPVFVLGFYMLLQSQLGVRGELLSMVAPVAAGSLLFWLLPAAIGRSNFARALQDGVDRKLRDGFRLGRWPWIRSAAAGFAAFDESGRIAEVKPGHWALIFVNALALTWFFGMSVAKATVLQGGEAAAAPWWWPASAPALAFVFLAAAILCLIGSFLTFVFDRYRLPLLAPLAVFIWMGSTPETDYVFPVRPQESTGRISPREVLAGRDRVIVVAAAGGGVQAAGWTARVLSGLAQDTTDFAKSVRAISAVSGGAVGSMYYLAAQAEADEVRRKHLTEEAWQRAVLPSLDVFAWALVTRDLPSALAGPLARLRGGDRAAAFEDQLARRAGLEGVWLSDWTKKTGGSLPAAIFNAFEVETGRPVVLATSTFPKRRNFVDLTAVYDVPVVTAARLSSSFAFVSPVARPDTPQLAPHLADGGYFDNYGLAALLEWLQDGIHGTEPKVLLIQIVSFPEDEGSELSPRGWGYQLSAPLIGIANMRSMSQGVRGETEVKLLGKVLNLQVVEFRFDGGEGCQKPPLSWDLSRSEVACLDSVWENQRKGRRAVETFLAGQ